MTEAEQDQALDALRHSWGEAYVIGIGTDGFWACRRDKLGEEIRGEDPDELCRQLGVDYAIRPVRLLQ